MRKDKETSARTRPPTIADLYPDLTTEEQERARENLDGYIEAVLRIYDRIARDDGALVHTGALTGKGPRDTMKSERSNTLPAHHNHIPSL